MATNIGFYLNLLLFMSSEVEMHGINVCRKLPHFTVVLFGSDIQFRQRPC